MRRTLAERVEGAGRAFVAIDGRVQSSAGTLGPEVVEVLNECTFVRHECDHWAELIETRDAARRFIGDLEKNVRAGGEVLMGNTEVSFAQARAIGLSGYLGAQWALADSMVEDLGRILGVTQDGRFLQFATAFFGGGRRGQRAHALEASTITFGLPAAVSYSIRNLYLHDGGRCAVSRITGGRSLFAASDPSSGFRIDSGAWATVMKAADRHRQGDGLRPGFVLLDPSSDLRPLLWQCEEDIDAALGAHLGAAVGMLEAYVTFLLAED